MRVETFDVRRMASAFIRSCFAMELIIAQMDQTNLLMPNVKVSDLMSSERNENFNATYFQIQRRTFCSEWSLHGLCLLRCAVCLSYLPVSLVSRFVCADAIQSITISTAAVNIITVIATLTKFHVSAASFK